ncbi:hypothetical protein MB46_01020 [Arthrobacter alpinus]|uniref:DUF559 domain-containing protein n=1 Tax=Arthrobacter alpinus TaxID=656366 RepID=UPI0005C875D4|nr:DUF559 domain-containing protein [Arthrobacter alpinus]ALV44303.1 hypothetical protein MB46_01020 [Arthrobacter alpinus]
MERNDDPSGDSVPFTFREALDSGFSPGQLRNRHQVNVSRGIYRPSEWQFDLREAARALSVASPSAWISHSTAARLHGLVLPPWLSNSDDLHLSTPRTHPQMRRKGIIGHNVTALPGEIESTDGILLSTRVRTWLDLARVLPLHDLVCLGDQLIRIPRPEFEGRSAAFATLKSLRAMTDHHGNLQGIVRAREALDLMRVGADSPPETELRLAMADANLPEPELQLKLYASPTSPSADAGYRAQRIALQYDGAHHLDEVQRHSDRRRDKAFEAAGWTVLTFTESDLHDGFKDAVQRIKKALRQIVVDPTVASGFASGS